MNHYKKTILSYVGGTFSSIVFQQIYSIFTPGVYAFSMQWMFVIPLVGGVFFYSFIAYFHRFKTTTPLYRLAYNLYNSGLATLTIGAGLNGVFEIALTDSIYLPYFWILGGLLTFVGSGCFIWLWNQQEALERTKE